MWNRDAFWRSLEQSFLEARRAGCETAAPAETRELSAMEETADRLARVRLDPTAAELDSVERRFFELGPLVAACPRGLEAYVRLSGRVRDAIIQKHISFTFPTRFKITEALAGFKRKVPPFIGAN
jgi:hypothetical protein